MLVKQVKMEFYFTDSYRSLLIPQTLIDECDTLKCLQSLGEQQCPQHITRQGVSNFFKKFYRASPKIEDTYEELFTIIETMIGLGYEGPLLNCYLKVLADKIVHAPSPPERIPDAIHSFYRFLDLLKWTYLNYQRQRCAPLLKFKRDEAIKLASYDGEEIRSLCFSADGRWLICVSIKVGDYTRSRLYDVSNQSLVADRLTRVPHVHNALIENFSHTTLTYIAVTHWPDSPHDSHQFCSVSERPIRIQHNYEARDYQETLIDILELFGQEGYNCKGGLQSKGFQDLPLHLTSIREDIELIHSEKNIMLDSKAIQRTGNDLFLTAIALSQNLEVLAIANMDMPTSYSSSIYIVSLDNSQVVGLSEITDFETYADYLQHLRIYPFQESPSAKKSSISFITLKTPPNIFILVASWLWMVFVFLLKVLQGF